MQTTGECAPEIRKDPDGGCASLLALSALLSQKADSGDCWALRLQGNTFWHLQYRQKDVCDAQKWRLKAITALSRAANDFQDATAQCLLAHVYSCDPVPELYRHVVLPLLTKSAEQNQEDAQCSLAQCSLAQCYNRRGPYYDAEKAKQWMVRAANNHQTLALEQLPRFL